MGERRRVLGRTCQVLRTATILATGTWRHRRAQDRAETCIDAAGLVLEELLVVDGSVLLRRLAIELDLDPDVDDAAFEVGEQTVPVDSGGGFVAETEPDSRQPGTFFQSRAGRHAAGRYVVIRPSRRTSPTPSGGASSAHLPQRRVRRRRLGGGPGPGGTLGGVHPFPDRQGIEVEVPGLGTAPLSYGRTGPTLLVSRDGGKFLRARGTVEPEVLVESCSAVCARSRAASLRLRDR